MLRVAMHALVASTLAGPPAGPGRDYDGSQDVTDAQDVADAQDPATVPPAPAPADQPAAETPTPAAEPPTPVTEPAPPKPAPIVAGDPMLPIAEDSTPEGPEDEDEVPYDPLVDSPEAIRARSWVRSGAVFTAIGGVLTIGAIAMSTATVNTMDDQNVCNPRSDPAGNGCLEAGRDRAVAALAIPGVLLLGGGIAMLAVGKVQQKRLRTSLRAGRRELFVGLQLAF